MAIGYYERKLIESLVKIEVALSDDDPPWGCCHYEHPDAYVCQDCQDEKQLMADRSQIRKELGLKEVE